MILAQCKYILRHCRNRGLLAFRRIHTVAVPRGNFAKGTGRFSKNHDMAGMPDFEVYLPGGRIVHVETKATKGKLSPAQVEWMQELSTLGHRYEVVRCIESLISVLRDEGVSGLPFK